MGQDHEKLNILELFIIKYIYWIFVIKYSVYF